MKYLFFLPLLISSLTNAQTLSDTKNSVAFIYIKDSLGNFLPNGTCFIIGKKVKEDTTLIQPFLVTAKHVLQKSDGSFFKEIFIRMNTKDSNSRLIYYPIDTSKLHATVILHPDESVDIALLTLSSSKTDYDFKYIPESLLLDRITFKSLKIEEGTEAFFVGLFSPYQGIHKIYPIFRFGHIALKTNEKIFWVDKMREMLLFEVSSYGGNSGSPVFLLVNMPDGRTHLVLAGILSGTFRDAADIEVISTSGTPVALYNNGISGVTPSYLLRDILLSIR